MKIQINNLEALERLIGNDNQLEFDIRQSVVEAFTRKHLKNIAKLDVLSVVATELKKEITKEFLVSVKSGSNTYYKLTDELSSAVKQAINNDITILINDRLKEVLESTAGIQELKQRVALKADQVEKSMNNYAEKANRKVIEQLIKIETEISDKVLTGKIDKMVQDKIKEKFNF